MLLPVAAVMLSTAAFPLTAQQPASLRPDSLRAHLFVLAADSMGGRQTGSIGDWKAQEWVASFFRAAGLEPAGENGTYFQVIPFLHIYLDTAVSLHSGPNILKPGQSILPLGPAVTHTFENVPVVYGGSTGNIEGWIDSAGATGGSPQMSVLLAVRAFVTLGAVPRPPHTLP